MTEFLKRKANGLAHMAFHWKLAIFKAVNGCSIVALGGIIAGLANQNWDAMDGQSRFLFIVGVTLSVLKSLDMLTDTTIGRLRAEDPKPPVDQPPAAD